jgi:hypothetical protein
MQKVIMRGLIWGLVVISVVSGTTSMAEVPVQFNLQGYLCDDEGIPVPNGSYMLKFSVWDDSLGGSELWSEVHTAVMTKGGLFSVQVGSVDSMGNDVLLPDDLGYLSENRYVQIQIGTDGPVQPRTRLISTPYSVVTRRILGDINTWPGRLELANSGYLGQQSVDISTQDDQVKALMKSSDGSSDVESLDELNVEMIRKIAKWLSSGDSSKTESQVDASGVNRMAQASSGSNQASSQQKVASATGVEVTRKAYAAIGESGEKKETVTSSSVGGYSAARGAGGDSSTAETQVEAVGVTRMTMASSGSAQVSSEQKVASATGVEETRKAYAATGESGEKKETMTASSISRHSTMRAASGDSSKTESRVDSAGVQTKATAVRGIQRSSSTNTTKPESVEQTVSHKSSTTDSTVMAKLVSEILARMRCKKASSSSSRTAEMVADSSKAQVALARSDPNKTDSVAFNAGGAEPSGLRIYKTPVNSNILESAIELYANDDGGKMAMPNPADTLGDGIKIEVGSSENMLLVRKGGSGSDVYIKASSSSGGKIGINTDSPTQALHVVGNICATGSIGACSDRRFKTDIQPLHGALEKLEQLRGVSFKWNPRTYPDRQFDDATQIGLVAQEVNEVLPELVNGSEDAFYTVDYARLTPLLLEAIKELRAQNESLKSRLETLENAVTERSSVDGN